MTATSTTLICWHAHRAGIEVLRNAIVNLRAHHRVVIDRVVLLDQQGDPADRAISIDDVEIKRVPVELKDPTRHRQQQGGENAGARTDIGHRALCGEVGPLHELGDQRRRIAGPVLDVGIGTIRESLGWVGHESHT